MVPNKKRFSNCLRWRYEGKIHSLQCSGERVEGVLGRLDALYMLVLFTSNKTYWRQWDKSFVFISKLTIIILSATDKS